MFAQGGHTHVFAHIIGCTLNKYRITFARDFGEGDIWNDMRE